MDTYYCIKNPSDVFNVRLKLDYKTEYKIEFSHLLRNKRPAYYIIFIEKKGVNYYVGNIELYEWEDINDYFILKADWRQNQINSILEDD